VTTINGRCRRIYNRKISYIGTSSQNLITDLIGRTCFAQAISCKNFMYIAFFWSTSFLIVGIPRLIFWTIKALLEFINRLIMFAYYFLAACLIEIVDYHAIIAFLTCTIDKDLRIVLTNRCFTCLFTNT